MRSYIPTARGPAPVDWHRVFTDSGGILPPAGYWPGEGPYGWVDVSGKGNHGTRYGATPAGSPFGGAGYFEAASSQYVETPLKIATAPVTISAWARTVDTTARERIVDQSTRVWMGVNTAATFKATVWTGGDYREVLGPTADTDGHYHVMRVSATDLDYYVDAVHQGTASSAGGWELSAAGDTFFFSGYMGTGQFWDGLIDEPIIFPYALTASQIRWLYNVGSIAQQFPVGGSRWL